MEEARHAVQKYALWGALGLAGAYVGIRFLLPCLLPFLLAFLTAALCEPAVRVLTDKLHVRRGAASVLCVLVVLLSLTGFFLLVVVRLADEAVRFLSALPELATPLPSLIERLEYGVRTLMDSAPEGLRGYMDGALAALASKGAEIPAALSAAALEWLRDAAGRAPETVLFLATYAIGSFFISLSFQETWAFISRQIPNRLRHAAHGVKEELLDGLARWLRAELTLMGVTFALLTASLMLLGVEYAAVIALMTAIIDALPVFGTGIVLLPWAAAKLIGGNTGRAVGLVLTYLAVTLTRQFLEPKLIGDQFGVAPAAALLAMYAGFKLTGVMGMVLFPFALMLLNQMNTKGTVKLWKQAEK